MHAVIAIVLLFGATIAADPVSAEPPARPVTMWQVQNFRAILLGDGEFLYYRLAHEPEDTRLELFGSTETRPETCNIRRRTDQLHRPKGTGLFSDPEKYVETIIFTRTSCPDLSLPSFDVIQLELRHFRQKGDRSGRTSWYQFTAHIEQSPEQMRHGMRGTPGFEDRGCEERNGKTVKCSLMMLGNANQPPRIIEFRAGTLPGSGTVIEG